MKEDAPLDGRFEQELPPRLQLFKPVQDTFDQGFMDALDAWREHTNLTDYDGSEILAFEDILDRLRADSVGRWITFDYDEGHKFRSSDTVTLRSIQKIDSDLFSLLLMDYEEDFYSNTESANFANVVVSSELMPFIMPTELNVNEYIAGISRGEVKPDYLSDSDTLEVMEMLERSKLEISYTLHEQDLDWPDAWLHSEIG